MNATNGDGALRARIELEAGRACLPMSQLTVLSRHVDPYRLGIDSALRDGEWLRDRMAEFGLLDGFRRVHLRGLHYLLVATSGLVKPNGEIYRNTYDDWKWLSEGCAKSARWNKLIDFETIVDARNSPPMIRKQTTENPHCWIGLGESITIRIPDLEEIRPQIYVAGFEARQPYRLVLTGEKTSLEDVLAPIAAKYDADLYLPNGEMSDTLIYQMARNGAEDGRPMIVFVHADFDPAGEQMLTSIARKLQALRDLYFRNMEFEVHAVALNESQVRELDLPDAPLKETEKRADGWAQKHGGLGQVEIDALAALQPRVLRQIVEDAIAPFYDANLDDRAEEIKERFIDEAQAELDDQLDDELIEALHAQAETELAAVQEQIDDINERLRVATSALGLSFTPPDLPEPELDLERQGKPALSSAWSWLQQTKALLARKHGANGMDDQP